MKTNSFIKIAGVLLFGLFASCEEKEDDLEITCELSYESIFKESDNSSTQKVVFEAEANVSEDDAILFWSIDNVVQNETGDRFEYTFAENGVYEVCVLTETPECPSGFEHNGVSWGAGYCKEIKIDNINDTTDGCPDIEFTKNLISNEGFTYKFTASGAEESRYSWFINDEYVQTGLEGDDDRYLTREFSENGTYYICVAVETPDCPKGTEYCIEVIINEIDENECIELEIQKNLISNDGKEYLLKAITNSNLSNFSWYAVDGDAIIIIDESPDNSEIKYEFSNSGTYEICALLLDADCESTIKKCIEIEVVVEIGIENVFDITVDNPHSDSDCLDLTYDYSISQDNPNIFTLEANKLDNISDGGELPDGYYEWSIREASENNDQIIGSGRVFNYEFTEVGNYVICVGVETPECPQGVKFCKNFKVEYLMQN